MENRGKNYEWYSKELFKPVHVIKEDYYDSSVLFAGTDNGLYYSVNDGNNWNRLKNNLLQRLSIGSVCKTV